MARTRRGPALTASSVTLQPKWPRRYCGVGQVSTKRSVGMGILDSVGSLILSAVYYIVFWSAWLLGFRLVYPYIHPDPAV